MLAGVYVPTQMTNTISMQTAVGQSDCMHDHSESLKKLCPCSNSYNDAMPGQYTTILDSLRFDCEEEDACHSKSAAAAPKPLTGHYVVT